MQDERGESLRTTDLVKFLFLRCFCEERKNMSIYSSLMEDVGSFSVVNTHCHHLRHAQFFEYHPGFTYTGQYDLNTLLHLSYCAWCGVSPEEDRMLNDAASSLDANYMAAPANAVDANTTDAGNAQ